MPHKTSPDSTRKAVKEAERVVLKVGTRVLTHDDGHLALARLFQLIETAASLRREGRDVLIVSSGAVGLGRDALGLAKRSVDLSTKQACAAVGQSRLMGLYQEGFSRLGLVCAQVLLTQTDFATSERHDTLRRALVRLLALGVIPVINENDVVSTVELETASMNGAPIFGDNDQLSALVATQLEAHLLVLLTDVPGVYARDPHRDPSAPLLSEVKDGDALDIDLSGKSSHAGRGGMRTKVEAARLATKAGCHAVITSGLAMETLGEVMAGKPLGTWFVAAPRGKA
ncbi:MAG: glutamate 5-kinase [Deltaproteobacteria bacterium]|nr:glutamate 5-kinase [Deltaproteobacteria bacterium]